MPTLDWIGKSAVVKHHEEVPFHLLREVPELSVGDPDSGNLLIQGDNLLALKALLPYYAGQVRCVYIDPPYNTGNEGWVYNDNVNSPEINAWLGKVVGKEAEDLSRHDKWLCMMYPRLVLLRDLISEDGSIWVSIGDDAVEYARNLLNEVFGKENFVATVIWQKVYSPKNSANYLSEDHDYILVYAKRKAKWSPNLLPRSDEQDQRYANPDNDPRGPWKPGGLDARNPYSKGIYAITCPSGRVIPGPPGGSYWRYSEEKLKELDQDNRIWWGEDGNNVPAIKRFLSEVKDGIVPQTLWTYQEVGHTQEAKKELISICDFDTPSDVFVTPKPTRLIRRILQIATGPNDIVLDSFAGTGTTAQAVLEENEHDGGNRRFILVETLPEVAPTVTQQRLQRVIEGYPYTGTEQTELFRQKITVTSFRKSAEVLGQIDEIKQKQEALYDGFGTKIQDDHVVLFGSTKVEGFKPGTGGGFSYWTLGDSLFDSMGEIHIEISFANLARYVFYVETGQPLPRNAQLTSPLVGMARNTAVYLLYDGIPDGKVGQSNAVLTPEVLTQLPPHSGPKVIYGTGCLLSEHRLREAQITFRQIPYDIRTR